MKESKKLPQFQKLPPEPIETPEQIRKLKMLTLTLVSIIVFILASTSILIISEQGKKQVQLNQNKTSPIVTPESSQESMEWKTYINGYFYQLDYPSSWAEEEKRILGSSYEQGFSSPEGFYKLTISSRPNYNQATGKPYTSLQEYANFPYPGKLLTVDGQEGMQYLPRAGSEHISSVDFFSRDLKSIYTIALQSGDNPIDTKESQIKEGKEVFEKIVSSFRFNSGKAAKLLEISFQGGLCPDNKTCGSSYLVLTDGKIFQNGSLKTTLDRNEVSNLSDLIDKTDFEKVKSKKFTGTCPIAYDGQEAVYTFYLKSTTEAFSSCQVEIDNNSPLFSEITKIINL